jgi:Calcium/calmodulin dependent protein kinase II Association.
LCTHALADASLSSADLTCVEPETQGSIVEGLGFHKHFFDLGASQPPSKVATQNTICSPHVRMLGRDHALVCYVRVTQSGGTVSTANETRLWKRVGGGWKNIHFHRSKL